MCTVRGRLDIIGELKGSKGNDFLRAETAAFHGRKVLEAIAFGCLVAVENGINVVPRDAKGQWNAETIFKNLRKKGLEVLPSPSIIRAATPTEQRELQVRVTIEGQPDRLMSLDELIAVYQNLHAWLHEVNPYTHTSQKAFYEKGEIKLWADLEKVRCFIHKHFISIRGAGFFCVIQDDFDGETKVIDLSKQEDLPYK